MALPRWINKATRLDALLISFCNSLTELTASPLTERITSPRRTPAFAAAPVKNKGSTPFVAVGLSVADPCQNSYYANMRMCAGQVVQHVSEVSEKLQPVSSTGETIVGSSDQSYTVRVIDFY